MQRRLLIMLIALLLVMMSASAVSACGGFFCTNSPIDQSAERIIFTVNDNDTLTAYIGIEYQGAAEDFSWLLPVPSVPEVDVAEEASLDTIQTATNRSFINPRNYCPDLVNPYGGGGGGGGGPIAGSTGPYDYVVLTEDDPEFIVAWLREFGYRVDDEMIPLIEYYVVVEDMDILAMRLSQGFEAGDIQPVKLTYQGQNPMIPIILTSIAAQPRMPILTWIFGDTQYVPDNWVLDEPDFTTYRAPSQIRDPFAFYNAFGDYSQNLRDIQAEHEGLAFITEYAQATAVFRELDGITDDPLLNQLSNDFAYVTRLRAQLDPEQMTVDPVFVQAETESPVNNVVDLADHTDPLQFWGCGTRSIYNPELDETLNTFMQIDTTHLAYPDGWVHTELQHQDTVLHVYAETAVTLDDVIDNVTGTANIPMAIYLTFNDINYVWPPEILPTLFDVERTAPDDQRLLYTTRPQLFNRDPWIIDLLFILTPTDDYEANGKVYDAMLRYVTSYQFYASQDLRHTLFIGNNQTEFIDPPDYGFGYFAYPEGWVEYVADDGAIVVVPEGYSPNDFDAPAVHLRLLKNISDTRFVSQDAITALADRYGLGDDAREEMENSYIAEQPYFCDEETPLAVEFARVGRQGYVSAVSRYYLEASVNAEDFETYADDLLAIATSLADPRATCG